MTHPKDLSIALVGPEFDENLSLRYLAGALSAHGYRRIEIVPFNSVHDAGRIADQLTTRGPDLVGVSMAFQTRAIEDMLLCELLRQRGYDGHITGGGQFVTLHYRDVLDDCQALDSIVMFEGEQAIVALAESLQENGSLSQVAGLAWRCQGASRKIVVNPCAETPTPIDDLAFPLRSSGTRRYLGLGSAHMVGSRGCHASCKYCCVAALTADRRLAVREAGGKDFLPGTRRRHPHNVAQEVALLYHENEARIFEFQDDNWIPPVPAKAIDYLRTFRDQLAVLGVGRIGITLKMRADIVTPEIIGALKEIGLIRVFVGIESGSQSLLSKLGRATRENVSQRALDVLREHCIPAYFNALLFGPDLTLDEIGPELSFLAGHCDFPYEIVEVVIYGRTGLYELLQQQNRLSGNYLAYDYQYSDSKLRTVYEIVGALQTRHFGVYSPIKMAADLGFNLGVLRVFYPGADTDAIGAAVDELTRRINQDQLSVIREAVRYANSDIPLSVAADLLRQDTAATDLDFYRGLLNLQRQMERLAAAHLETPQRRVRSYFRGGLVASGLVAGLLCLATESASAAEPEAPQETPDPVEDSERQSRRLSDAERRQALQWIGELDSDQFAIRERATRQLSEMVVTGFAENNLETKSLLDQATRSDSVEVRSRARQILVHMWLQSLRSANAELRQRALVRLADSATTVRPLIEKIVADFLAAPDDRAADIPLIHALRTLLQKRQAGDAERLREAVTRSVPQLHVATGLVLKVDAEGSVVGAATYDGPLDKAVEQTILRLLAKRQFKAHEITGRVQFPMDQQKALRLLDFTDPTDRFFEYLRMRRGPLD